MRGGGAGRGGGDRKPEEGGGGGGGKGWDIDLPLGLWYVCQVPLLMASKRNFSVIYIWNRNEFRGNLYSIDFRLVVAWVFGVKESNI